MNDRTKILLLSLIVLVVGCLYINKKLLSLESKNEEVVNTLNNTIADIRVNPEYVRSDPTINQKGLNDDVKKGLDISAENMVVEDKKVNNLVKLNLPYLDLENDMLNEELLPNNGELFIV